VKLVVHPSSAKTIEAILADESRRSASRRRALGIAAPLLAVLAVASLALAVNLLAAPSPRTMLVGGVRTSSPSPGVTRRCVDSAQTVCTWSSSR
jgi:hypothetical protein